MSMRNQVLIGDSFFTEYNDNKTKGDSKMKTYRIAYTTEEGLEKVEYKRFKNLNLVYLYVGRHLVKLPIKGGVCVKEM